VTASTANTEAPHAACRCLPWGNAGYPLAALVLRLFGIGLRIDR
jgi:hypothetical protein